MADDAWGFPEIGWPELRVHPVHLLEPEDHLLLELLHSSSAGLAGPGHLPGVGGVMDQAACTWASLGVMRRAEHDLEAARGESKKH